MTVDRNRALSETMTKTFISFEHAAKESGFSLRQFQRLVTDAGLKVVDMGRKRCLIVSEVENWKKGIVKQPGRKRAKCSS